MKPLTKAEFIERVKKIHADKYDCSKAVYVNSTTEVLIKCNDCGKWFKIRPDALFKGNGHKGCTKGNYKKTLEENFFRKIQELYGDRYDYSETHFDGTSSKIRIICRKHNKPFYVIANNFLKGFGCQECEAEEFKQKRIDSFVKKAKEVKPEYDYSNIKYNGIHETAIIRCYKHGEFDIVPHNWLINRQSCPMCQKEKDEKKRSNEEITFLQKAKEKFGNKFDFSNIKYKNNSTDINFKCNDCGNEITISPSKLLTRKIGCRECSKSVLARPFDEFIKIFNKKRGDKITLLTPEEEYKNEDSLISARCNVCGNEYKQCARNLMFSKYSCKKCASKEASKDIGVCKPMTKEEFIKKSVLAHPGEEYDYSKVVYVNHDTPVNIYCPKHKLSFWQKPRVHYAGSRCKLCAKDISKPELIIINWLNSNNIKFEYEHNFDDLRDKALLSYDFYLPEQNILIEYNGKQHYSQKAFNKTWKDFLTQKHHDWLKRRYAEKNGYKLIIIPYWEFDNINNIMEQTIIKKAA